MTGSVEDRAAIEAVVAAVQRTQREELVDEFVELFVPDALWTTSGGVRLIGRDAIRTFTQTALPGAMTQLQGTTYTVTHVSFLRADIAAVQVHQVYADNDGVPIAEHAEGVPLYVMTKNDGRWRLAACQNTPVPDP